MGVLIQGSGGNDTLSGGAGDTLQGGLGNDLLQIRTGTATVQLDADGSSDQVTRDGDAGYAVRLGSGLGAADLQLVWTRAIDGAGQYTLRLTHGRGELLLATVTSGSRPENVPGLQGIQLADGQWLSAAALAALITQTVQAGTAIEGTSADEVLDARAWSSAKVTGGSGNDTILAGADPTGDTLQGGAGDDVYAFNAVKGSKLVLDGEGQNIVRFGPGVRWQDVRVLGRGDAMVLAFSPVTGNLQAGGASAADEVVIAQFWQALAAGKPPVTQFIFEGDGQGHGGLTLSAHDLALRLMQATPSDDIMQASGKGDLLDAGEANDLLFGGSGADTLLGGYGNDTLSGGGGTGSDDSYIGGVGDDLIVDGYDVPYLNTVAGHSSDTYRFNRGDGADVILDVEGVPMGDRPVSQDTLRLGEDIRLEDVELFTVTRANPLRPDAVLASTVLRIRGTRDGVTLVGQLAQIPGQPTSGANHYGVDDIVFADGTRWDRAEIHRRSIDTRHQAGLETGTAGQDTFTANGDDQAFEGGAGSDVYLIDGKPLQVRITDGFHEPGEIDELRLAEGIRPEQVRLTWVSARVFELSHGAGGSVLLEQFAADDMGLGQGHLRIAFADGTVWNAAEIERRLAESGGLKEGGVGDDTLDGTGGSDYLRDLAAGHNLFMGSLGHDTLQGSSTLGVNTYRWSLGQGSDEVRGFNPLKGDTLLLDSPQGIRKSVEQGFQDGRFTDVLIRFGSVDIAGPDALAVMGNFAALPDETVIVRFADGSAPWTLGHIRGKVSHAEQAVLLEGSDGNDAISGRLVRAGQGDDTIHGTNASGQNLAIYNPGDGHDFFAGVRMESPRRGTYYLGSTTVRFGDGIRPEDIKASKGSIGWDVWATDLSFTNRVGSIRAVTLERVEFADGTVWGLEEINLLLNTGQTPGSNLLVDNRASTQDTQIRTGGGRDTILGGQFREEVNSGAGDDSIHGGGGEDALAGEGGHDTITGGANDDLVAGGEGADTYIFNVGDGRDLMYADAQDTLVLGEGLTRSSLYVDRVSESVHIYFEGRQERLRFGVIGGDALPGLIRFADGSTMSNQQLLAELANPRSLKLQGTAGFDTMVGGAGNDTLTGLDGSDVLAGGSADDLLDGSAGNDWLSGDNGNDKLVGGAGDDILSGDFGRDTLHGGLGNDQVQATHDVDMVLFNAGDGVDTLFLGKDSSLLLGAGLTRAAVSLSAGSERTGFLELKLSFNGGKDAIYLADIGTSDTGLVQFSDGTTATAGQLLQDALRPAGVTLIGTSARDTLTGGDGHDTLSGLAGNDLLAGGLGNDSIDGGTGNDTLRGGLGNDTLIGTKGNDTYQFTRGDGRDAIIDSDATWFNSDLLQLSGVATNQLWFTRSGSNLDIAILGTQDKVTVQDWFKSSSDRLEKITATDSGKSLTAAKVNSLVTAMAGFSLDPSTTTQLPANTPVSITRLVTSSWV